MNLTNRLTAAGTIFLLMIFIFLQVNSIALNTPTEFSENAKQDSNEYKLSPTFERKVEKNNTQFSEQKRQKNPSNVEEVENSIVTNTDSLHTLAQKIRSDEILEEKMLESLEQAKNLVSERKKQGELDVITMNLYQELAKSSSQERWDDFSHAIDSLEVIDSEALQSALFIAISSNAPIEIIKALLYRGASFTPDMLSSLAYNNNVQLTKQLIPLGLDIHQKDGFNKTGIQNTLKFFASKKMFDFLLLNGVAVNTPASHGRDALDMALMRLLENNDGLYYAMKLLEHGAIISTSHKTLLSQLKSSKPNTYQAITNYIH